MMDGPEVESAYKKLSSTRITTQSSVQKGILEVAVSLAQVFSIRGLHVPATVCAMMAKRGREFVAAMRFGEARAVMHVQKVALAQLVLTFVQVDRILIVSVVDMACAMMADRATAGARVIRNISVVPVQVLVRVAVKLQGYVVVMVLVTMVRWGQGSAVVIKHGQALRVKTVPLAFLVKIACLNVKVSALRLRLRILVMDTVAVMAVWAGADFVAVSRILAV
mmetsp:Transcript_17857/g.44279  ORF Transcript_17857/g.44279 Transcript_17857/m.44279 type:complete len:222 (+) Transcript_17857:848-1513(+)